MNERVAEIGRDVDQRPVQRVARSPGLTRLLPPFEILDRAGGTAHRPRCALARAARPESGPQLFCFGLGTIRGQRDGLGFGRGHQLLDSSVGPRRGGGIAHQPEGLLPSLPRFWSMASRRARPT